MFVKGIALLLGMSWYQSDINILTSVGQVLKLALNTHSLSGQFFHIQIMGFQIFKHPYLIRNCGSKNKTK